MIKVGMILDEKYEILKKIGQGGMSIVYLAMDIRLNKQWAVKEIRKKNEEEASLLLKSIRTEANILKMVDHPALPRIVDIVDDNGTVFVVMDYIEGRPLSELLKTEGAQPQDKVIEWAKELCSALDYLHSMKPPIIYRDMKPSNIMLKPDGRVKLIDFGTAKELDMKSLADTTALGTRGYAAPEQFGDAKGRGIYKTDVRTDIYSLGATIYHIVTGKNPCEAPYVIKPIRQWNPGLSNGLEKIIMKCTMANPEDRYQNCAELMYALEHYEELDDAYRKACFRKMRSFFVCAVLSVCCFTIAITGYVGNEREINNHYEKLMREGYTYTVKGQYEEAISTYINAITGVDGTRNTAYMELLDLYTNYMDDAETGLNRVTYYMNQKYQNIHKDQTLLFHVAMVYFEVLKDYKSSVYYFNLLDLKEYPEAEYYIAIAMAMGELNTRYDHLLDQLIQFEKVNDNAVISTQKLMNYRLLCTVYVRNLGKIEMAAQRLIQVADKGLQFLESYEDDSVKAEYYIAYNQHLALAYEYMGASLMQTNEEEAAAYYKKALACCDLILSMVSANDNTTIECIADYQLREAKYCQKAEINEALGEYEAACRIYEQAEKEYQKNSISLYTGHLSLLCKIEEKKTANVEMWDYDKLYSLYKEGKSVPGIEKDYRWKQITQKLLPLFEKNGGK